MGFGRHLSSLFLGVTNPKAALTTGSLVGRATRGIVIPAGTAAGVTEFLLAPAARGIHELITGEQQELRRRMLLMEAQITARMMEEKARSEARQQYVDQNVRQVMTYAPDLAQKVLAGRRVTQGGVAIGGRQRTDLLQELASYMADGSLQ